MTETLEGLNLRLDSSIYVLLNILEDFVTIYNGMNFRKTVIHRKIAST